MSNTPHTASDRQQSWCLRGLAESPADVRTSERRLSRELGREPSLRDVVEDLMARHRIARPFTSEYEIPIQPSRNTSAR